jgi:hypothetical protein
MIVRFEKSRIQWVNVPREHSRAASRNKQTNSQINQVELSIQFNEKKRFVRWTIDIWS